MHQIRRLLFGLIAVIITSSAVADEGMWLPLYLKKLNEKEMRAKGLKLTADDIYNINNSSLKDAVISLGGFCTGEIVSPNGLVFTNHHCAYDKIASHSTVENDYLSDGFWARTRKDELANPGLTASILVRMEDVTDLIVPVLENATSDLEKQQIGSRLVDSIEKAAVEGTHYVAEVEMMFEGAEYYLMVYEVFKDVRLVGAPPSSIGKFGGDTDNWMWPRHTGDFAIFRIYSAPDGKPAEYSTENVPYKPKHHFPISLKGYQENDFAMIFGFPGSTERYLTSYDISHKMNVEQPALIKIFEKILDDRKELMDRDKQAKIDMASSYASLSNYHKYLIGQLKGLKSYGIVEEKQELEAGLKKWINASEERKEKYGNMFSEMDEAYAAYREITPGFYYFGYGLFQLQTIGHIFRFSRFQQTLENTEDEEVLRKAASQLKVQSRQYFKSPYYKVEQNTLPTLLSMAYADMKEGSRPAIFEEMRQEYDDLQGKEAIRRYVNEEIFEESFLFDSSKVMKFLEKPKAKKLEKDDAIKVIGGLINFYRDEYIASYRDANSTIDQQHKLYLEALRTWKKDEKFYPDANSTLRLTYGEIESYEPRDAVYYNYYTTQYGLLEKEVPGDSEFDVPAKLKKLLVNKDFGRYGVNDTLFICFLTDNDITGGNSGSPVINGNGELIGIAFDGNWEAMTGDIVVDPSLNRTISVDIRYVLFIIDKFAEADHLLDELTIVTGEEKKEKASAQ